MAWRRNFGSRATLATLTTTAAVFVGAFVGCIERPIASVSPRTQSGITEEIRNEGVDKVDLLMMVDNSNSMKDNQANITSQFATLIQTLTDPPCTSDTNATPHECDPANPNDHQQYPAVKDLHVGVVDSDLGTPGHTISGCSEGDVGDDGLLNPIHYGLAIQHHLPWTMPSMSSCPGVAQLPNDGTFRPMDCQDPAEFPAFITFASAGADDTIRAQFTHDFRCNAALYVCGCGLESQIESVWRALIWHGAGSQTPPPGGDNANAGFLRDEALLAIVELTDEEDGSVQNCNYALPGEPCTDHTDVYGTQGTPVWAADNPNLRFYLYQPGGSQDPTWPMERYYDPHDVTKGFLSLKPNHPERIVFAAITSVPLPVPHTTVNGMDRVDWNALLGSPGADPNDFNARDESMAARGTQPGANGPYTMQTGLVSGCTDFLAAACYREDQTYNAATPCSTAIYRAVPARRVIELARRFDESPLCGGGPCNNGIVESICASDYSGAMRNIITKIQSRLQVPCLPRVLDTQLNSANEVVVQCLVREIEPDNTTVCANIPGRVDAVDSTTMQPVTFTDANGNPHKVCDIQQVPTYPPGSATPGFPVTGGLGWYYDTTPMGGSGASCAQRISFTAGAAPAGGTETRLECIQSIRGVDGGANTGG